MATEDDVLMSSGPGGKHMALYEVYTVLTTTANITTAYDMCVRARMRKVLPVSQSFTQRLLEIVLVLQNCLQPCPYKCG